MIKSGLTGRYLLSANEVRNLFLEYFRDKSHYLVRSSPVMPFKDPSLAFVNAGMNQFKNIILGSVKPPHPRVMSVQKCVRVGGKHNDLDEVGRDHTHHTFFEMLGNWSFNDYFKEEACSMAWTLLTDVYKIPKEKLHVTYFGGDANLNLPPDLETKEIWLNLGVPVNKVMPLPASDNFWQMADTGPCGVCTEIHYNGIEIWNLVFMEYIRCQDGVLQPLDKKHVDTGMGFERLVALLQGHKSTYDTELFTPLLKCIKKFAGGINYLGTDSPRDCAFRILADHSRMLSVTLSDGFYPHDEYETIPKLPMYSRFHTLVGYITIMRSKVRNVLRRAVAAQTALGISSNRNLIAELCCIVAETLGHVYPELATNLSQVYCMINTEINELEKQSQTVLSQWSVLCKEDQKAANLNVADYPGLLNAYLKIKSRKDLPVDEAWRLCETFGVPVDMMEQLAKVIDVSWDDSAFQNYVTKAKAESLANVIDSTKGEKMTDDVMEWLFSQPPSKTRAIYKNVKNYSAKILGCIAYGVVVDKVELNQPTLIGLLLDRTNMYPEGGGQDCDVGEIIVQNNLPVKVHKVENFNGRLIHWIKYDLTSPLNFYRGDLCELKLDVNRREKCSSNHTGTHLLQASLQKLFPPNYGKISQNSSRVTSNNLLFNFSTYRNNLTVEDVKRLESLINKTILNDSPVRRLDVSAYDLPLVPFVTLLPGAPYLHKAVTLIEVISPTITSREPCCGTHVERTSHLKSFAVTAYKSLSVGVKSIRAVTGNDALAVYERGRKLEEDIADLAIFINNAIQNPTKSVLENCEDKLTNLVREISTESASDKLPYTVMQRVLATISALRERLRAAARDPLRKSMSAQMQAALHDERYQRFLVVLLHAENRVDTIPLQKATRMCENKPCLIVKVEDGMVKARCCVPENIVTEKSITAEKWLKSALLTVGGGPIGAPRHQEPDFVCLLKGRKLTTAEVDRFLQSARDFALQHF